MNKLIINKLTSKKVNYEQVGKKLSCWCDFQVSEVCPLGNRA